MTSYIHEIYNESGPNMAAMKAVLHNLYFLVTLPKSSGVRKICHGGFLRPESTTTNR